MYENINVVTIECEVVCSKAIQFTSPELIVREI